MDINGKVTARQAIHGGLNYNASKGGTNDYNQLYNKPSIGGVTLVGDKSPADLGIPVMYCNTTAYFNSHPRLIGVEGALYIYTDHMQDGEGNNVPGIKVGDGKAYLIDTPFTTDPFYAHIINQHIHVTLEDKARWDDKVSVYVDTLDPEKLVFTTD